MASLVRARRGTAWRGGSFLRTASPDRAEFARQAAQYGFMDPFWTWFIDHMTDELHLVAGAPALSLVTVAIIAVIARAVFGVRIANLRSEIGLLDARVRDYKDKLSGRTPDEAKARLDALEQQVARLAARRLSQAQRERISTMVLSSPAAITVANDMAIADAAAYAADIATAFRQGGWYVNTPSFWGASNAASCGLTLRIPAALTLADPPQQSVVQAFNQAEVDYELQRPTDIEEFGVPPAFAVVAEILITARVT